MKPCPPLPEEDMQHILAHTGVLWEELRGQRVFLTGGTGFFGKWLLESFLHANDIHALGASITVLTRDPASFRASVPHLANHPAVTLLKGDVKTFEFPSGAFSFVIHAATEASAKMIAEEPLAMIDTIVEGTRRTLDFAVAAGARRVLLTSSGAVYGRQPSETTHIAEEATHGPDCLDPGASYAEGKRLAELLGAVYQKLHGIEVKISRCFAFVGPHLPLDTHFAVGNFLRDAMAGGPIRIGGDGTPHRSYLYAADLAIWLWTMLVRAPGGRAYNVGSSDSHSIREIADVVCAVIDPGIAVTVAREPVPGRAPERYVPDVQRAERELGLRAWVPLPEALSRTARWARSLSQ